MSSDVFIFYRTQASGELKSYSPDFTDVIPSGASIPAASAATSYTQTYNGSASGSATTTVNAAGTVPTFRTPSLSTGYYQFTVTASLSDGQVRRAFYYIRVDL